MIDYTKLRIGDMVVCGGRGPSATVTRIVTAGWRRALDHSVSVHTGLIVKWAGQFYIAEMLGKGLTISPPSRYNEKKRRYIIGIRRHKAYADAKNRSKLLKKVSNLYRNTLEYDWKGLLSFVSDRVEDNPKRCYCSEFFYQVTLPEIRDGYPQDYEDNVSPFDLQYLAGWSWPNVYRED